MSELLGILLAAAAVGVTFLFVRASTQPSRVRSAVLDEVRGMLRGGVIDQYPGRGPQARGRLGELEVTVDLWSDPARPAQSPFWRVLAVGPVRLERPIEVRVGDWKGWIDPWLQLGETVVVPKGVGPEFTVHAENTIWLDHPVIVALRRQGAGLTPGAFHARTDLMRAEIAFGSRVEDNRALFAYLHAMGSISETTPARPPREVRVARTRRLGLVKLEPRLDPR